MLRSKLHPHARLVDTAREFAVVNMTTWDAFVVVFHIKYHHALWRPLQAINYADEDNNVATDKDPTWTSKIPTPSHPEYPSAHVTLYTATLCAIARLEGESGAVDLTAPTSPFYPGGTKTFESLAAISDAGIEARVNIGFHFHSTGDVSQILGREIGDYVADHALLPISHN